MHYIRKLIAIGLGLSGPIIASPLISIDKPFFDAGVIAEGKKKVISHIFHIKNIGDSTLRIQYIRPGCGCMVVEYDSIIPPGREGKANISVDLNSIKIGETFEKSAMVASNAKNNWQQMLTIQMLIQPAIKISTSNIQLSNAQNSAELVLSTEKRDFEVNKICFRPAKSAGSRSQASWQSDLSFYVGFSMQRSGSAQPHEYVGYKIKITCSFDIKENMEGTFILETNHPDKPQLSIPGRLDMLRTM